MLTFGEQPFWFVKAGKVLKSMFTFCWPLLILKLIIGLNEKMWSLNSCENGLDMTVGYIKNCTKDESKVAQLIKNMSVFSSCRLKFKEWGCNIQAKRSHSRQTSLIWWIQNVLMLDLYCRSLLKHTVNPLAQVEALKLLAASRRRHG